MTIRSTSYVILDNMVALGVIRY
ncbi:hypothetical protein EMIT0P294_70010 [Pseudomonas sp. IT-P294]